MSNYCACSGGDEEYTIELNQQGPEGPQGPVGPEGFSPSISVKTSTDNAYILTVVNKEGNFDTPNLYGEIEKLNADLSNLPNPAVINGISLSSIEDNIPMITMDSSRITTNVDGNLILNATASNEETMEVSNYEVVVNPKEQRLELHDNEGNVKIVATTDYIPTINVATTTTAGVVKPDGSTITVTPDGTISAVAPDLSNYVTNDELSVDLQDINSKIASKLDTATYEADKATYATKEELASTDATVASIQTSLNNKLEESNIIAGTNITIDRNGNNLTINSIGGGGSGGGASIDDSTTSSASTWSSSKINSEITTAVDTINYIKNDNIFDISKFTVVGMPTITDNGIASEFSSSAYVTSKYNLEDGKIYAFVVEGIGGTPRTDRGSYILSVFYGNSDNSLRLITGVNNGIVRFALGDIPDVSTEFAILNGVKYKIELKTDFKTFVTFTDLLTEYTLTKTGYSITNQIYGDNVITYGSNKGAAPLTNGSIDLSAFKIYADEELVFKGTMSSTKPIYDKITSTSTALTTFQTDTDNNFSAVNSALNEKANLSDLAGYVTVNKYNELLARVVALETEINGGNA